MPRILSALFHVCALSLHQFARSRIAAEMPGAERMPWDGTDSVAANLQLKQQPSNGQLPAGPRPVLKRPSALSCQNTTDLPIVGVL